VLLTPSPERSSVPVPSSLPIWQLIGLLSLFKAIASASVVDPRPAALDRLRVTFRLISSQTENDSLKIEKD
jgi:hypothetical protein